MSQTKTGRPKSERVKRLEAKILKLEIQIDELVRDAAGSVDESTLTEKAVGIHYDKDDKHYQLVVIKYNPGTRLAKVVEQRRAGDAAHRAEYELNKFMAYEINLIKQKV